MIGLQRFRWEDGMKEAIRILFGEHRSIVGPPANAFLLPAGEPKSKLLVPASLGIVQFGAIGSRASDHQRQLLAAGQVPQTDRVVLRAGGEAAAVGRNGDGLYNTSMSFEAAQLPAAGQVPQTDRVVRRSGGEAAAVRRKGDRRYSTGMPF